MGTTQEELQAFYVLALPGFLEYLRTHQSRIEDVELATVLTGIKSMPVTQTVGGVEKTVRVPFALITANVDQAEALAREMAAYALAQGNYAKAQGDRLDIDEVVSNAIAATASANEKATYAQTQGDYAKNKGDYANEKGAYANTKGDYAKDKGDYALEKGNYANTQGANANSIYTTVSNWYNGANGFKATVESWIASVQSAWNSWFGTSDSTGVKGSWKTWFDAVKAAWTAFYTNGVVPEWATLKGDVQTQATYAQTQGDYAKQQGQNAAAATSEANAAAANANEKAALAASSTLTADALILQQREEIANSQQERQLLDNSLSSVESAVNAAMTAYGLVQNLSGVNPLAQKPATIYADVPDVLPVGASFMIVPMAMPDGANASVIYQKEGDAVRVKPSGEMVALSAGTVTVWIVPTLNSAAYIEKSVTVRAREVMKQDDDVVLYADDGTTYLEV